jgi:hypothetical protein
VTVGVVTGVDPAQAPAIQRRTIRVLSMGTVLGGVAVAGSVAAGSLIAASVGDSEAAAGLAQTAGVLGAAVLALRSRGSPWSAADGPPSRPATGSALWARSSSCSLR